MDRRIRIAWSGKRERPWCPGATTPERETQTVPTGWTGFFNVQGLVELIRRRTAERNAALEAIPPATPAAPADERTPRS